MVEFQFSPISRNPSHRYPFRLCVLYTLSLTVHVKQPFTSTVEVKDSWATPENFVDPTRCRGMRAKRQLLYVSGYYYICVRILLHVSAYRYIRVRILLYTCPHIPEPVDLSSGPPPERDTPPPSHTRRVCIKD